MQKPKHELCNKLRLLKNLIEMITNIPSIQLARLCVVIVGIKLSIREFTQNERNN